VDSICHKLGGAWIVGALLCAGCNDPYSQRRIESRWEHVNSTVERACNREADGVRRVNEAGQTLGKWWKDDCRDWSERWPTIGDYVW